MNATQLLAHFDRLAEAPNAVPRLRRFILDLAVRGKLVEQDAGDEPASTLLKQIESEIARLVKIGEMRKPKTLPPIETEDEPFDAPTGWCWVRIRQVTSDRGQTTPAGEFTYIDVGSINKEAGVLGEHKVLSASDAPSRARKVVGKGDVLYSCVRPTLLNIAVVEVEIKPTPIASTAFAVLNSFGLVLPRYLWIALRSPYLEAIVESGMRGQAYPAINDAEFALLPLALPPLTEQHRIVAKVDELMALCDQLEAAQQERERRRDRLAAASLQRLNQPTTDTTLEAQRDHASFHLHNLSRLTTRPDHIKAMREVILDAAFQGTLTTQESNDGNGRDLIESIVQKSLSVVVNDKKKSKNTSAVIELDVEPPFPTPFTWGWASLQILCEQIGDIDHKMPRAVDVGVPFLSARDLKDGGVLDFSNPKYISEEDFTRLSRKVLPKRNDIIYSRIGARLGKARLVEVDTRFLISYSCCLIRPKHEFIDKRYLQIFLDSHLALQQAHSGVQSIGVPDLGLGEIKAYRIPVPPLAEQHRIVAKVDELMALCDQLEAQLTTTQTDSRRLLEAVLDAALTSEMKLI